MKFGKFPLDQAAGTILAHSTRLTGRIFKKGHILAPEDIVDLQNSGITEVIAAANRDYDRNTVALPGPVSGYCLGKDPLIFEYAFQNIEPKRELPSVWLTALKSSQSLVPWTVNQVKGPNVLVAGLSFKENIDDFRMAFSEPLIESLLKSGFEVSVCDPNLKENMYTQLWPNIEGKIRMRFWRS